MGENWQYYPKYRGIHDPVISNNRRSDVLLSTLRLNSPIPTLSLGALPIELLFNIENTEVDDAKVDTLKQVTAGVKNLPACVTEKRSLAPRKPVYDTRTFPQPLVSLFGSMQQLRSPDLAWNVPTIPPEMWTRLLQHILPLSREATIEWRYGHR